MAWVERPRQGLMSSGASCSGKTLLAKHIRSVLPSPATIIHQDDFVPPMEDVPYSKEFPGVQDWDDPPTCIIWDDFRRCLEHVRTTGALPAHHSSHDHLNKQVVVGVETEALQRWRDAFAQYESAQRAEGTEVVWFIVDGFVLYWDKAVTDALDVRVFLRVPHGLLKRRREERQTYVLQNPDDAAAGGVWVDPPNYFDQIVYPGYVKAHAHIFDGGGDGNHAGAAVEKGVLRAEWRDRLRVVDHEDGAQGMTRCFEDACGEILGRCEAGAGAYISI